METNEDRFESDIESYLISEKGGYKKGSDVYDPKLGVYLNTFISFIKESQPNQWVRFENANKIETEKKFVMHLIMLVIEMY